MIAPTMVEQMMLAQIRSFTLFGEPLVTAGWARVLVVALAYVLTLGLSGVLVRFFVLPSSTVCAWPPRDKPAPECGWPRFDPSVVIGKCENIVTVTLVLTGQIAGLALIFAAKSLVRSEAIKRDPGFYLGGTMVNLVWGLVVAMLARVVLG